MKTSMRSGLFLAPFHQMNENPAAALQRDLELVQLVERLGYDEVWVGEHHSGGFEIIASPEVFIAVAAERTKNIRLGTGVMSLPYHNPFILTERMVQLDYMTRGRVMFGVGPGALVHDAAKLGIAAADQRPIMNEALDIVVRLLNGETVTHESDYCKLQDAVLHLPPYSRGGIEMAVAASRSPTGALAAGKYGIGMLSIGGTTPEAMERHASNWSIYETESHKAGHTPNRDTWRIVTMFHIAETREQARENVKFGLKPFCDYFRDISTFPVVPPDIEDPYEYMTKTGAACIGTPDDAIAYIERIIEGSGGYGVITEMAHNWADWPQMQRHYELMARYVHPHFQGRLESRKASYDFALANHGTYVSQASAAVNDAITRHKAHSSN